MVARPPCALASRRSHALHRRRVQCPAGLTGLARSAGACREPLPKIRSRPSRSTDGRLLPVGAQDLCHAGRDGRRCRGAGIAELALLKSRAAEKSDAVADLIRCEARPLIRTRASTPRCMGTRPGSAPCARGPCTRPAHSRGRISFPTRSPPLYLAGSSQGAMDGRFPPSSGC